MRVRASQRNPFPGLGSLSIALTCDLGLTPTQTEAAVMDAGGRGTLPQQVCGAVSFAVVCPCRRYVAEGVDLTRSISSGDPAGYIDLASMIALAAEFWSVSRVTRRREKFSNRWQSTLE